SSQSFSERIAQFQKLPFLSGDIFARDLDLTEYVLAHSSSCYFIKVKGNGMSPLNIFDGDLLVVDRSLSAKKNDLVIATQNGEFLLMQFAGQAIGQYSFFPDADVGDSSQNLAPKLWGVITHVIHHCR
ncbi:MAG: S24 family peptidase, partial [Bacteroidota bacterium]